MVTRYLTGSLKQCSPARAHAMAAAKRPPKAGFGTRSECKKWALAKTNASRNPSRDAQCAIRLPKWSTGEYALYGPYWCFHTGSSNSPTCYIFSCLLCLLQI